MKKLLIFLMVVQTSSVLADDEQVQVISKGQTAPFSGYLFPESKAQQAAKDRLKLDGLEQLNNSLQISITLYQKNSELDQTKLVEIAKQNDNLALRLRQERESSALERVLWVGLGVLAAGVGAAALNAAR